MLQQSLRTRDSQLWASITFNSSPPNAAYMWQIIWSALVQIMACCLFGTKLLSKPMLGYCQLDKLQWNFNQNTKFFIHGNAPDYTICKMKAIVSRKKWVKMSISSLDQSWYLRFSPHFEPSETNNGMCGVFCFTTHKNCNFITFLSDVMNATVKTYCHTQVMWFFEKHSCFFIAVKHTMLVDLCSLIYGENTTLQTVFWVMIKHTQLFYTFYLITLF